MCRAQRTLAKSLSFEGPGIHTGAVSKITVNPAAENHGIVFSSGGELIPATYKYVVSTQRSTMLGRNGVTVSTVEHLMAALGGLNIDNALIEVCGPEIPILDGSALPFCQAMLDAGFTEQQAEIEAYDLKQPVFAASGDSLVLAMPDSQFNLEGDVCYASRQVGHQRFRYSGYDNFVSHVAPARTFGFWAEVEALLAHGLGRGGDLSNALIFDRPGFVPEESLRFKDEPVRHKVLDLAGDINLLGRPLNAFVLAVRAGHKLHVELISKVAAEMEKETVSE